MDKGKDCGVNCTTMLFIVQSSFQLISAILIRQMYLQCKCYLILDGNVQFLCRIGKTKTIKNTFDRVVFYNESRAAGSLLKRCIHKFKLKQHPILKNKDLNEILTSKFDRVFYFSLPPDLSIIIGNIQKECPDIVFCKLEDGLASYIMSEKRKSRRKNYIAHILFNQFYHQPEKEEMYLLYPELYVGTDAYHIIEVKIDSRSQRIFEAVCAELVEERQILNKNIIFEECLDQFSDREEYVKLLYNLERLLRPDISIKGHPRNAKVIINVPHIKMEIPWEMYCLSHKEELRGKKFFSLLSTTCYIPQLFGIEDVESFYLYPCYKGKISVQEHENFNKFISMLIDKYPSVHLVDNLEELKLLLGKN